MQKESKKKKQKIPNEMERNESKNKMEMWKIK